MCQFAEVNIRVSPDTFCCVMLVMQHRCWGLGLWLVISITFTIVYAGKYLKELKISNKLNILN